MISAVASQQKGPGFEFHWGQGLFCVECACSICVCVGSAEIPWLSPTTQRNAFGDK